LIVEGSQDLLEMVFFIAIHHLLIREADLPGYLLILLVMQLLGAFYWNRRSIPQSKVPELYGCEAFDLAGLPTYLA
jgi:hypothetical protein